MRRRERELRERERCQLFGSLVVFICFHFVVVVAVAAFPGKPLQHRATGQLSDGYGVYLWRQPASLFVIVVVPVVVVVAIVCLATVPMESLDKFFFVFVFVFEFSVYF